MWGKKKAASPIKGKATVITLKGRAMLAAINAGMIPRNQADDGYDAEAFMKFWDEFSPAIEQEFQEREKLRQPFEQQRDRAANHKQ